MILILYLIYVLGLRRQTGNQLHKNVSRTSGHSAVVVFLWHQDVAIVSPVGRPRVLHQPVLLTKYCTIANSQHCMIKVVRPTPWHYNQHSHTLQYWQSTESRDRFNSQWGNLFSNIDWLTKVWRLTWHIVEQTGLMTQPTESKYWRRVVSHPDSSELSISPGSPHQITNTIQQLSIQMQTNKSNSSEINLSTVSEPSEINQNPVDQACELLK